MIPRGSKFLCRALGTTVLAPGPRVSQEQDHGEAERENAAYEEVSANGSSDDESGVDAEGFYEEASEGVEAHVEHGDVAVLQTVREASGHPQEYEADDYVPDRLVQEGGVEGRGILVPDGPVLRSYVDGPGQLGGPSEELLVEVVAPAPYRLGQDQSWCDRVGEGQRADAPDPGEDQKPDEPSDNGAVDPESPVPDFEHTGERVLGIEPVVGDNVVGPGADEAERHDKEKRVQRQGAVVSLALQFSTREPGRDDDAERYAKPVIAEGEGPHFEHYGRGRARQGGEEDVTTQHGRRISCGKISPRPASLRWAVRP